MGQTGVANTDVTGEIQFYHNDASGAGVNADIKGICTNSVGAGALTFGTGTTSATERMRIDANGHVGIGISNPASYTEHADDLVVGGSDGNRGVTIIGGDDDYSILNFNRVSNTSTTPNGALEYNHDLNQMYLKANGTSHMYFMGNGEVQIPSGNIKMFAGNGIDFANASAGTPGAGTDPAETSTATVLDDYEEGTFTPVSNSVDGANATRMGMYVKVGNLVNISVRFSPSGDATNGHQFGFHLPFKAATTQTSGSYNTWFGNGMFTSANGNGQHRVFGLGGDGNYVNVRQQNASNTSEITGHSMTGSFGCHFSITYRTVS
jgi:predicted RecA/RadA family phage recombinase